MKGKTNWDKPIILILPIIFLLLAYLFSSETLTYTVILVLLILMYEFVFYKKRHIYGIDGIRQMSFPAIVYISYTVLVAIPAIVLSSTLDHPRESSFILSIYLFYIFFPIGLLIGNAFFPIKWAKTTLLSRRGLVRDKNDANIYEILIVAFSIVAMIVGLYLIRIDSYPILELIRNPKFYLSSFMMREEAFKLLKVSFIEKYIFSFARDIFIPLLIMGSLFLSIAYKKRKYWILFYSSFALGMINNSISLAKMPTAAIFLSLVSFYFVYKQSFKLKTILAALISVLSFPYMVVYFVSPPQLRHAEILIPSIFRRIFIVPSEVLFQYFKIFPDFHTHLMGRSTKFFSWLHPEGGFNTANYVAQIFWKEPQTTGSANAIYLGNFWADFGITGVILSSIFVGWFVHFLYQQILETSNYQKNVIYLTFVTALTTTISFSFVSSSFTVLLVTKGLFLAPIILWVIRFGKYVRPSISNKLLDPKRIN